MVSYVTAITLSELSSVFKQTGSPVIQLQSN